MRRALTVLVLLLAPLAVLLAADAPTPKGHLLPGWKQLGLTDEQRTKLYAVEAKYGEQIADLERQVKELKTKQRAEELAVLTDAQKARLKELAEEKVSEPPAKDADKKPDKE